MDDGFIRLYIEDLLRTIRTQVLLALIRPYTRCAFGRMDGALDNCRIGGSWRWIFIKYNGTPLIVDTPLGCRGCPINDRG